MTTPEQPEEEPQKPCPMCAGTGKVRDYKLTPAMHGAGTFFTIDPADLERYNFTAICGT